MGGRPRRANPVMSRQPTSHLIPLGPRKTGDFFPKTLPACPAALQTHNARREPAAVLGLGAQIPSWRGLANPFPREAHTSQV